MKTFQDDVNGKSYTTEKNIKLEISFTNPADKKFYKATMDISPDSLMGELKPLSKTAKWGFFTRYSEEEKKQNNNRAGFYTPVNPQSISAVIASMQTLEVQQ